MKQSWNWLVLVVCLVLVAPAAMAQLSDLGPTDGSDADRDRDVVSLPPPFDDEICDDETIVDTLTCEVTKITMDLDAPLRTATFWGEFCANPSMTAGQEEETPANALERDQHGNTHSELEYHEIIKHRNFGEFERETLPYIRAGHWGGDRIMFDQIFRNETKITHLKQQAGVHVGFLSVLIGFAARRSIDEGRPVRIAELSDIRPQEKR